jgi:hypothetical protein
MKPFFTVVTLNDLPTTGITIGFPLVAHRVFLDVSHLLPGALATSGCRSCDGLLMSVPIIALDIYGAGSEPAPGGRRVDL